MESAVSPNRKSLLNAIRCCLVAVVIGGCLVVSGRWLLARDRGTDTEKSGAEMITPKTVDAIQKGLDFLASKQHEDGSFGAGGYGRNVAVCGLAGMAFIASGSTPGRGPHGKQVDRCLEFILAQTAESGFIDVPAAASHG